MCAVGCDGPAAGIEPPMLSLDSGGGAVDGSEGSSSLSEDEYISDPEAANNTSNNNNNKKSSIKSFSGARKVKMMCSYGGRILPRPQDSQLRYMGGETRIVVVSRDIRYMELMEKLARLAKRNVLLKYQLPNEDLDALISVTSDEDVTNMMDEHDKMGANSDAAAKLRAFLFPARQGSLSSEGEYACDFGKSSEDCAESFHLEQDYSKLSVQRNPTSPPRSSPGLPLAGYLGFPKEVLQRDGFHNAPKAKMPRNHSGERNMFEMSHDVQQQQQQQQRGLFHPREELGSFGSLRAYQNQHQQHQHQHQHHEHCFDSVFMGDGDKQVKSTRYPQETAHMGHVDQNSNQEGSYLLQQQQQQHHSNRQNNMNFHHQHQQQQEHYHHAGDEGMNHHHHPKFAVQCKGCKVSVAEASFLPPRHPVGVQQLPRPAAAAAAGVYGNPHHHQFHHHHHPQHQHQHQQPAAVVRMMRDVAASKNPFQIEEQHKVFNATTTTTFVDSSSAHHHLLYHHS